MINADPDKTHLKKIIKGLFIFWVACVFVVPAVLLTTSGIGGLLYEEVRGVTKYWFKEPTNYWECVEATFGIYLHVQFECRFGNEAWELPKGG